ncbi:NitT/TauT family transport system permease protein [Acetitomaculum ruminis DSM 5522]|uniref:NitT/TauT family transport system permease protein n=1 Tax=Acetitomaculum ruminis DSM 5522 TaxID=1120918 RepID=A0A1I0ZLK4_9FIRM|nr:ABC transporter permease subunit [Acetitomaculum ruminis]SFB26535.1 NitT/TauT family transport system permease protein [Acetitomaculum ruminis DSM 5522]
MEDKVVLKKMGRRKKLRERIRENPKWQKASTVILPLIFGIILVGLWQGQVLHRLFHTDTFTLPLLDKIGSIMADNKEKLLENTFSTLQVSLMGLVIGSILGYLMALLASFFPKFGQGGLAVIGAFASIPVVAMAPVFNNWTKDISRDASFRSMISKTIVVMLICAADMGLNAYKGLTNLKPYALDLMAIYASSRKKIFFKLRLPNSIPYVFSALKVSVPASIMTAIVSEYFAEYITGVGRQIRENIVLAQYSTAWAYIATACLIGIFAYAILMILQSIFLKRYH